MHLEFDNQNSRINFQRVEIASGNKITNFIIKSHLAKDEKSADNVMLGLTTTFLH